MKSLWIFVLITLLATSVFAVPLPDRLPLTKDTVTTSAVVGIHHRHKKHHYRHKHRRRSLDSKERTNTERDKNVLLMKPYWPWP